MKTSFYAHPTSEISPDTAIGAGTKIWQYCTILAGAEIGEDCLISQNVYVEGRTKIGDRVKIKNNVSLYECVQLEENVFIGPSAVFTNVLTPRSHWSRKEQFLKTIVQKGATIGANATIVCGVNIGRYAMVGAGSVVTKNVADFALVHGSPARRQGWACYCGEVIGDLENNQRYCCDLCDSSYEMRQGRLEVIHLHSPSDERYE